MDATQIIDSFLATVTPEQIKTEAATYLKTGGFNCNVFNDDRPHNFGVCGYIIKLELGRRTDYQFSRLSDDSRDYVIKTILGRLAISETHVPVSAAIQDSLALLVKIKQLLKPLFDDPEIGEDMRSMMYRRMDSPDWMGMLNRILPYGTSYETPDEVVAMPHEDLMRITKHISPDVI
jgi:hypothetical protein